MMERGIKYYQLDTVKSNEFKAANFYYRIGRFMIDIAEKHRSRAKQIEMIIENS